MTISLDADPDKKLTGKVISVANVGEQRPNQDAKVFEVKITVEQSDTTLRPGMTTSNAIETTVVKNVLSVPIEAVSYEGAVPYVFRREGSGVVRREIETGIMNDDAIVVKRGLDENDVVLLSPPPDRATLPLERLPGSTATQTAAGGRRHRRGEAGAGGQAGAAGRRLGRSSQTLTGERPCRPSSATAWPRPSSTWRSAPARRPKRSPTTSCGRDSPRSASSSASPP